MLDVINNKELGIKEILSITLNLFKRNFKSIMIVVLVLFFPISIVSELVLERLSNSLLMLDNTNEVAFVPENLSYLTQTYVSFIQNYALLMIVLLFLVPVGTIAIVKITKSHLCNENIQMGHIMGEAMSCIWGVIITGLIYIFFVFLASVVCVVSAVFICLVFIFLGFYNSVGLFGVIFAITTIPIVYFVAIWIFYVYIVGLRGIKGWKALVYSNNLVKNRFWKTIGFIVLTNLIVVGWELIADGIFMLTQEHVATNILSTTIAYFLSSFVYVAMTVLFMNREAILLGEKYSLVENEFDSTIADD